MTLTRVSGAKSLRDPLLSQLLGEWVASSALAKARGYEATEVAQLLLIRNKPIEAVKQYASVLFVAPELIWFLMDLNVAKGGFRHVLELMTRRGGAYTGATGLPFPRPIPSGDCFTGTWKELVNPLPLDRHVYRFTARHVVWPLDHCIHEPIVVTRVGTKGITCSLGSAEPTDLKCAILGPQMTYTTGLGSAEPSVMLKYKSAPLF